jgi:hypothetical protein
MSEHAPMTESALMYYGFWKPAVIVGLMIGGIIAVELGWIVYLLRLK